MTITKVKYEKLFPTGAYLNEKIGFEADLTKMTNIDTMETHTEDPLQAIEQLRILTEQSHKEKYPHLYTQSGKPITIEQTPLGEINLEKEKTEIAIDNCTSVEELKKLEGDAIRYLLVEQYLNKKKSLS